MTDDPDLSTVERAVLAILIGRHYTGSGCCMPDAGTALEVHVAAGLLGGGARPEAVYAAAEALERRGLVRSTRTGGHRVVHVTPAGLSRGVL